MSAESDGMAQAGISQAFDALPYGALILDLQGQISAVNAAARRLFGLPGTQAIGQPATVVAAELQNVSSTWPSTPVEFTLRPESACGQYRVSVTPLFDAAGVALGYLVVLLPAPEQLAAAPSEPSSVWNLMPAASALTIEPADLWRAVGDAAEQFLGNAPNGQRLHSALSGLGQATRASRVYIHEYRAGTNSLVLTDLLHEWALPQFAAIAPAANPAGWPLGSQELARWRDLLSVGKPVHGRAADFPAAERKFLTGRSVSAILLLPVFADNQWWGVLGFEDQAASRQWHPVELAALQTAAAVLGAAIQLRRTLSALRESEARSRALVDALPDTLLRLTRGGQILDFQGRTPFGQPVPPETLIGRNADHWLPPQAMTLLSEALAQAAASQKPQTFEYVASSAGEPAQHFEARLVLGEADEIVLIIRDISERARLEQMKSDFIHRAAHDLRTPLTTASLAASIIQEGGAPDELEQYWKILRTELNRQRELIEELLTLGRLESGTFQLTPITLDVTPVLRDAIESLRPQAEKRAVRLESFFAPDLPRVVGDRNGLAQVFMNLLDNAIKFSPPDATVSVEVAARADGVSVRVGDHGMGIPKADIPHLFTRFFRASNAVRQEIQGTGVGLFIAKAIVDQLNGHVSVESEIDAGTTFEVWLPRYSEEAARNYAP